jgi:LytR cell envelope-related transcriptional attenuator
MSVFSGMSRPMKAAGVVLVGVAIVAAVIGGITALSGGDGGNEAGPSGTSTQPGTSGGPSSPATSSTATPPSTSTPASPTSPPPTSPPPGQPTSPAPGQPGQPGGDQQASNKWVTVRVYNNSLIEHLAARAADDFRHAGWNVTEVKGYPYGTIPATTAYYRPGTDEEAAAKALAQAFGFKAEPRFDGIKDASAGVIVIVTKDYGSNSPKGS